MTQPTLAPRSTPVLATPILALVVVLASSLAVAGPAAAQSPGKAPKQPTAADLAQAESLFQRAEVHKRRGDQAAARGESETAQIAYGKAARAYLQAYELSGYADLLYNAAQSYRLSGQLEVALIGYKRYVALVPDADTAPLARQLIAELEAEVARARRSPGAAPGPATDRAPAGDSATSRAAGGDRADPLTGLQPGEPPGDDAPEGDPRRLWRIAAWLFAGMAVTSAGVWAYQSSRVNSLEDRAEDLLLEVYGHGYPVTTCSEARDLSPDGGPASGAIAALGDTCDDGAAIASRTRITSVVMLGSAVAAGLSFYIGYSALSSAEPAETGAARIVPVLTPQTVGAELELRF